MSEQERRATQLAAFADGRAESLLTSGVPMSAASALVWRALCVAERNAKLRGLHRDHGPFVFDRRCLVSELRCKRLTLLKSEERCSGTLDARPWTLTENDALFVRPGGVLRVSSPAHFLRFDLPPGFEVRGTHTVPS